MKLGDIAKILGSGEVHAAGDREPRGYSIDSRSIREGDLFFAVRGEKHDGHDYVRDALTKGAVGAVVARSFETASASESERLIRVDDTLAALQSLASAVVSGWRGSEVAITGSMGKTTTKEMTAAALARRGRVHKTAGNLNNAYGLPLSILRMETDGARASDFDFAVLEMGMNHRGEIAELTRIAPPDLGLVTNVAPVHLEFFPSVDQIAEAKAEMVAGVKPGGVAVLNADDERVARMRALRDDIEFRTFGMSSSSDVRATEAAADGLSGTRFKLITPRGSADVRLPIAGSHNIYNALAAAAVADYYEAPLESIAAALAEVSSPRMRGEVVRFADGFALVDDSYNSNPRALVEMARTVCGNLECSRKVIVAGEMLELGETGAELHRETGRVMASMGVDLIIGVRGLAREIVEGAREAGMSRDAALFCETAEEAGRLLAEQARPGDLILVKGSRGVKTEIVVEAVKQRWRQESPQVRDSRSGTVSL